MSAAEIVSRTGIPPRIGGLFAGYAGLDMAVEQVFGGSLAWYSEIDKGALKILTHRFPDAPNVGDVTAVDWSQVEPVDILTGGSPCQDLSHAGRRAGMTEGTRSNLWVAMREAIAQLRPAMVVWENVGGAASAAADSEVEPCAGCVGDGSGVHLRALGRVVGDLSSLGYDSRFIAVRASDIGAPHGRLRYFLAADAQGDAEWLGDRDGGATAVTSGLRRTARRPARPGEAGGGWTPADIAGRGLLPTPTTRDHKDHMIRREPHRPDSVDTLSRALTLLPTPRATDGTKGGPNQAGSSGDLMLPSAVQATHWGDYAAAIAHWETTLGRPAPEPTQTSAKGNPQLSPRFVEWMMGLPAGWVTDVPGITRNEALKALGNGVVPQQAVAALVEMLSWGEATA